MAQRTEPGNFAAGAGGSCLAKLRAEAEKGTRARRKIAAAILNSPARMLRLSIEDLAVASDVSTGTITGFCRKLGYSSYRTFQIDLSAAIACFPTGDPEKFYDGCTAKNIVRQVFACSRLGLEETERMNDPADLEKVAGRILKARRTVILGIGASALAGSLMEEHLVSLGLNATALADPYRQIFVTGAVDVNDVVIGISHSGESSHVVEGLAKARERNAFTVAVTNYPQSSLGRAANVTLVTAFREHKANAAVSSSSVAQICLLDGLYFMVGAASRQQAARLARESEKRVQRMLRWHQGGSRPKAVCQKEAQQLAIGRCSSLKLTSRFARQRSPERASRHGVRPLRRGRHR